MKQAHNLPPVRDQIFFYIRLALYLVALILPVLHPSILVSYDGLGKWLWFFVIPVEMLIAFYLVSPVMKWQNWALAAAAPIIFSLVIITGFSTESLLIFFAGLAAFALSYLIFHAKGPWRLITFAEPFLLALLYYRLLLFSRSSVETAEESGTINQVLFVIIICATLIHAGIIFLALYSRSQKKLPWKELGLITAVILPLLLVFGFLLPPDFVENEIVPNLMNRKAQNEPVPLDIPGRGPPGGNLIPPEGREGDDSGEEGEDGRGGNRPSLEGIPSDRWQDGRQGMGGNRPQYAVMVLASPAAPVYAADAYFGNFDQTEGFVLSSDNSMNDLSTRRLLTSWQNPEANYDKDRRPVEMFFLSTLPERFIAYRPSLIEPTIRDKNRYPFEFSYRAQSGLSFSGPSKWSRIDGLSEEEKSELASYLEIPLSDTNRSSFKSYLESILDENDSYYGKLDAILRSFSEYQYQLGFDDRVHVSKMENFLLNTKQGDCTEFSNTAAILARLAGIPTRVVTGYLGSRELQTMAHLQGLLVLQEKLPVLQDYDLEELFLITTAHRHSWIQVYMPAYGWVDIETTQHAIPPPPGQNPSNQRIVIPLFDEDRLVRDDYEFPWATLGRVLGLVVLGGVAAAYVLRSGKQLYLMLIARRRTERGIKALFVLLLIRLANHGYAVKERSATAIEYAENYPILVDFARVYTKLRYKTSMGEKERQKLWKELKREYHRVLREASTSKPMQIFSRLFSLRSLRYL